APATGAIRGFAPKARRGVGAGVNAAPRLLGSTLGVAVIGSVYASLYSSRLAAKLPARLPAHLAAIAHNSAGAALTVASQARQNGHPILALAVQHATSSAFFHGLSAACLLAAGVSGVGALLPLLLLPAHPVQPAPSTV